MELRKVFLMFFAAGSLLLGAGLNSCANNAKTDKAETESGTKDEVKADSVETETLESVNTEDPTEVKAHSLDEAPTPVGELTTWLVANYNEDGWPTMFILEGKEGRLAKQSADEDEDALLLRLVSYKETFRTKDEENEDFGGPLVVNAYDSKTKQFVGQYKGEYSCGCVYEHGEVVNCGESFGGTFTRVNGKTEEFSFYGD